ncbi:hypothetical protein SLE2022_222470 [Rubroshorea leprosula]
MAESRRYAANQQLDLQQIQDDAKQRWLRPVEICEILQNYQKFNIAEAPPNQPRGGSLFLFNRKALRNFRKDGHCWRKKKDGKTVREAHEKLKLDGVDVLQCYYAHGEENENFQRRIYWLLDLQLDNIVLVHYREVKEGYSSVIPHLHTEPGSQIGSTQTTSASSFTLEKSPAPTVQTLATSRTDWNVQPLSSQFEDDDSGDHQTASSPVQPTCGSITLNPSLHELKDANFPELSKNYPSLWFTESKYHDTGSSLWHNLIASTFGIDDQKVFTGQPGVADFITPKLTDIRLPTTSDVVTCGDKLIADLDIKIQTVTESSEKATEVPPEHCFKLINPHFRNDSVPQMVVSVGSQSKDSVTNNNQSGELNKLDSFGRWMDKEIGADCDDSLMASDSGKYWNTPDTGTDDKEVSSLSHHMQLDMDSPSPYLSQEQLFNILDISPDWAYSGVETKVLIVGEFFGNKELSSATKWGCMFGEIEVSAEVLTNNVIRCQTPSHSPGNVPFYVTCSDRLACSEVREFVFHEKPSGVSSYVPVKSTPKEELCLQIRLEKLFTIGPERKWLHCSVEEFDKCKLKDTICSMSIPGAGESKDSLIQNMLKDRLSDWILCKVHEDSKALHVLDDKGQGVIHLAAALGYDWAIGPIVAAGVNPNFRDIRGRTALHWASCYGREETVITLIRLGAAPGALEDPTTEFAGGRTAADLASSRGHKGIAGYLAEAALTAHLSSLTVHHNETDNVAAIITTKEAAAQVVLSDGDRVIDEQYSPIAAVRKSTHAAALIQDAIRQLIRFSNESNDASEVSLDTGPLGSLNKVLKIGNLHAAAVKIQKKYRGWRRRKDFLKKRSHIIKIQAFVRGHQVRKQYKKVVWSVGIVEKAILRWRRKRTGLRGFRAKCSIGHTAAESERTDEYEFLRIGCKEKIAGVEKALARVKSMVDYPEGRDQYMRLVRKNEELKVV